MTARKAGTKPKAKPKAKPGNKPGRKAGRKAGTKPGTKPRRKAATSKTRRRGTSLAQLESLALALPGMEKGTSYGTPAFRTRKKLLARLWEDGETLVLRTTFEDQEALLQAAPDVFFLTDHYRGYPMVLVRLAKIAPPDLGRLLEAAWRDAASKKQIADHDAGG